MKTGLRRALSLALGFGLLAVPSSAASTTFTDVPSTYWGYSYITEAASKGLVSGIGNGQYGPEDTLSNAQFVTMVCSLFYSDQVASQGSSQQWWRPYMNVAYSAGLLQGTTVAQQRTADGDWTASAVDAEISRYDMAQIISNIVSDQNWEQPDNMSLVLAQLLIKDWSSIPTQYQTAVAIAYAKGFLSGDDNGNFNGSASSTRAQAAVVLCSLEEANTQMTAPVYTNTSRLTNGLTATEENVADLVDDLWASYPDYDVWDVDRSYTSQRLGTGSGSRGFVYMLSDKIFGAMPVNEIEDPADLRVGDVLSLDNGGEYGLVSQVSGSTFTYASCDSAGWISWKNDMFLEDLGRDDTVYTRYLTLPQPDDVLANGDDATERNVERILDDLQDDRDYEDGEDWDMDREYDSEVFGSYSGDRGFAYRISDEIFGELDYERLDVDYPEDMRLGDVIFDSYHDLYGVVVDVDYRDETYTYVSIDGDDRIDWNFTGYFSDLDLLYTRYPENTDSSQDDELTNGDRITTGNVSSLLDEVVADARRDYDDYWEMDDRYNSEVFGSNNYDDEAFAYYISDEIFGNRDYDYVDYPEDLRPGDVIYDDESNLYGVVLSIDEDGETCDYVSVESDGWINDDLWCYFDDLDLDQLYTRY